MKKPTIFSSHSTINTNKYLKRKDNSRNGIYLFFLIHMVFFGMSGFIMAYNSNIKLSFVYLHGGFALLIYTVFYLAIFGADTVKWMFINAALGILGIYSEIDWLLSFFGKKADDYPFKVHVIPFLYYILYTFLIRQAVLDITGVRDNPERQRKMNILYVVVSVGFYSVLYFIQ